jgi:diguanylate cyclase (GGDEF)-like protein
MARSGTALLRRLLQWIEAHARPENIDERVAAGRLAAALFLSGAVTMIATVWLLPHVRREGVLAVAAVAAGTAAVLPLLPWQRWPRLATVAPVLWGLICIGLVGTAGGALEHYLPFYSLAFLYVGYTQRQGMSLWISPVALLSVGLAVLGHEPRGTFLDAAISIVVGVSLGELLARAHVQQRQAYLSVERLLVASERLSNATTEREATQQLAALSAALLGSDSSVVLLSDHPGSNIFTARATVGLPEQALAIRVDVDKDTGGVPDAVHNGLPKFVRDAPADPRLPQRLIARFGIASIVYVPIPGEGGVLGVVLCIWRRRKRLDPVGQHTIRALSAQAGPVLERLRANAWLTVQSRTDPLTKLANRRVLISALDRLPLGGAIAFIDLDHFKELNDRDGHAAGDVVLQNFAEQLAALPRREGDCAARYGGEEFALVVAHGGLTGATALIRRLRSAWQSTSPPVTFSAGIAVRQAGESAAETLARADAALYSAKESGRDRTVIHPGRSARYDLPSQRAKVESRPINR